MVTMGNVWDRTTEFLSDHLGRVLPIALLTIFVPGMISTNLAQLQPGADPAVGLLLGGAILLLALVSFWGQLAVTALAIDPGSGRRALGLATRCLPAALLLAILAVVVMVVLVMPVGVMLALAGVDLATIQPGAMPPVPPGAWSGLLLYLFAVTGIGLWVMARLAVILPALVGERLALGAIPRSWRLTRGVALRIVGVLILYFIVASVAGLAATGGFGTIMALVAGTDGGLSIATVVTSIVSGAVSTGFTVLGTVFLAKLYVALLARAEAAPLR